MKAVVISNEQTHYYTVGSEVEILEKDGIFYWCMGQDRDTGEPLQQLLRLSELALLMPYNPS